MNLNLTFENYKKTPSEGTLSEVLKKSQLLIYGVVEKVAHHSQDAEDLTQEVLIKVIQNINLLPNSTDFVGWLNRVSLNTGINHYHQKKRIQALTPKLQEQANKLPPEIDDETIANIYQHLSKLENAEESLIINKYIHMLTYDQMSILYKQPRTTIESKINNILKKLKISIEKAGFAGVAMALVSTLDQVKAVEVKLDLLPKIKEHYPATYPKVKPDFFSSKVLLKVFVPVVAALIAYFTIDHLNSSNQTIEKPSTEFAKLEKKIKTNVGKKVVAETNNKNQTIAQNETTDFVTNIEVKETIKKADLLPIAKEEPKAALENEFAGQLIDAETKKPIADAKLEIWDIYTYDKFEATTDAEGKYFIPKGLDTTFFFYLKFIKEDYAAKQTFQHFEIHKKILVSMNKGKTKRYQIHLEESLEGEFYIGSNCNLENEPYLSSNQKQILEQIFSNLIQTAPLGFYTFKKFKLEKIQPYYLNLTFELLNGYGNFVIWSDGSMKRRTYTIENENKINLYFYPGSAGNGLSNSVKFLKTGKLVSNKELEVFNYGTLENYSIMADHVGKVPNTNTEFLENSQLSIGDNCYYANVIGLNHDFDDLFLSPYSLIDFEPLSLNREYHNAQALFGRRVFSKKSHFRKAEENVGDLKVYDKFFEKKLAANYINIPIGGVINVNAELNSNLHNFKEIKIKITLNNRPLNDVITVTTINGEGVSFGNSIETQNKENDFALFKIPNSTGKIIVRFSENNISYSKLIDLNQTSKDTILLNFNKKLDIQLSLDGIKIYEFSYPDNYENSINIFNDTLFITIPKSKTSIFIEDGVEYIVTDAGYGIKTINNRLKSFKTILVKDHIDKIEIKPVSDLDYTSFHVDFCDEDGNEIKPLRWLIVETNNFNPLCPIEVWDEYTSTNEFSFPENEELESLDDPNEKVGKEAIKNGTVLLLNNRRYILRVIADNYIGYGEYFFTKELGKLNKKVTLKKSNTVLFKLDNYYETNEITKLLKEADIIYEYNGVRINNKKDFIKAQQDCNQEKTTIKLIRNNLPIALMIPAFQIHGLEDHYYDDKDDFLSQ